MVTDTRETNDSTKLEEKEENANTDLEAGRISDDHTSSDDGANEDDTSIHSSGHHSAHGDCGADTIIASPITRLSTNVSLGPDNPVEHYSSFVDVPDAVYDRIPRRRKLVIVALLSYCAFLAPISSTTVLSATPEIAKEFGTSEDIINVTNALYMLFMGISPIVWGPFSEVWGRKIITCTTAVLFFGCSIGTALSPNLAAFFIFRILTAFEGTSFLLVGSACLQDIYRPTERATAMSWFLSGTLIGPATGPFIGGIIVQFSSWRNLFWLQTALSGVAALGAILILPETIHRKKADDLRGLTHKQKAAVLWKMVNPWKVLKLIVTYPNLLLVGIASSSLVWNMYSLLTPIRFILNARFGLTSPLKSGLFYLAPGAGYLVGTFMGGRYADYTVKKYIARSPTHRRIPEDRLRSALPFLGIVIPGCVLVYGWCVEKQVGGIPVVVIPLFLQGVAQLFCFPSLNTYCLDVMQARGSDVIAGNYFVRYLFACMGTAVVLPAVKKIGVGWFCTISAVFLVCSALGTWAVVIWGRQWRERVDGRKRKQVRSKGEGVGTAEPASLDGILEASRRRGASEPVSQDHGHSRPNTDPVFIEKAEEPKKPDDGAVGTRE